MIKLLCSKTSLPSGRILQGIISELRNERVIVTCHPEKVRIPHIRYGNSFGEFSTDTILNSPEFIRMCSSKLAFSNLLVNNNVYTPIYERTKKGIDEVKFPVLVRRTLSASGGKGIILCKNKEEFDENHQGSYWTPYIPTEFELRVHILGNEIVRIFRKDPQEESEYPIRNNQTCHFSLKEPEKYPKLTGLVSSLNDLFRNNNLNFGFYALDVGWDREKKSYFIFEANSAPGLNEHTAELYARYINDNLEVKEK